MQRGQGNHRDVVEGSTNTASLSSSLTTNAQHYMQQCITLDPGHMHTTSPYNARY